MLLPKPTEVPSEGTIEQMSNHHLLNLLDPNRSWFYIHTKNEEKQLGYDASLQGCKGMAIQYKRLMPTKTPFSGTINIKSNQHRTLLSNFPKRSNPYAFYGFSLLYSYKLISDLHTAGAGYAFGAWMVFVDIHDIAPGAASFNTRLLATTPFCNLYQVVNRFRECSIGIWSESAGEQPERHRGNCGRVSLLWSKISP